MYRLFAAILLLVGLVPTSGTTITYDALDRVARETNSDTTFREYTYGPDTTTIVDEEGRETVHRFVAFSTISGGGSVFIEPAALPVPGTYTVLIDPSGPATGPATLYLYDVVDVTGAITPNGPAVPLPFSTPGQKARLTFSGSAGQRMSVRLTTSPQSACVASPLAIRMPDDTTLVSLSACGTTFMEPATLPTPGTYTVLVDPGDATVPTSATVTLYDVAPDFTGSLTINGSAVAVPLLDPGQNGTLTFTATAGQQVTVRMTGNTIGSTTIRLFRPDGSFQAIVSSGAASFNMAPQTLATAGMYTVTVDPYEVNVGTINVAVTSP